MLSCRSSLIVDRIIFLSLPLYLFVSFFFLKNLSLPPFIFLSLFMYNAYPLFLSLLHYLFVSSLSLSLALYLFVSPLSLSPSLPSDLFTSSLNLPFFLCLSLPPAF